MQEYEAVEGCRPSKDCEVFSVKIIQALGVQVVHLEAEKEDRPDMNGKLRNVDFFSCEPSMSQLAFKQ